MAHFSQRPFSGLFVRPRLLALVLAALSSLAACSHPASSHACKPGRRGCACTSDQRCDGDLVCSEGMCAAQETASLVVLEPRARGCEVLLVDDSGALTGVDFGSGVRGTTVREAPKTAVVFIATDDKSIGDDAVTVRFKAGKLAPPTVHSVSCTDANGALIAGAKVEIRS